MRAAYWAAFQAELERLDARQCKTGYGCGSSCISLAKDCQKTPKAATGKERLRRISQLAGGEIGEGKGLGRLRQSQAAAVAEGIKAKRSSTARTLREWRSTRELQSTTSTEAVKPPVHQGLEAHLDAVRRQSVIHPKSKVTPDAIAAMLGELANVPGEAGQNAANLARFVAGAKVAVVVSPKTRKSSNTDWLEAAKPVLMESAKAAVETTHRPSMGKPATTEEARAHRSRLLRRNTATDFPSNKDVRHEFINQRWTVFNGAAGLSWREGHNIAILDRGAPLTPDLKGMRSTIESTLSKAKDGKLPYNIGTPLQLTFASSDNERRQANANDMAVVLIHELGHQIHARATDADGEYNKFSPRPIHGEGAVSMYGATNAQESFAEAFVAYVMAPESLRKHFPVTHSWVEERMQKALGGWG